MVLPIEVDGSATVGALVASAIPMFWALAKMARETASPLREYLLALGERTRSQREHELHMHGIMEQILERLDIVMTTYQRIHDHLFGSGNDRDDV